MELYTICVLALIQVHNTLNYISGKTFALFFYLSFLFSLEMALLFLTFLILALPEGYKTDYACFRVVGQVNCGSTEYVPVKVQLYDDDDNGK